MFLFVRLVVKTCVTERTGNGRSMVDTAGGLVNLVVKVEYENASYVFHVCV